MDDDGITRMAKQACLRCGYTADAAGEVDGDAVQPTVGDLTFCLHCGHVMAFGAGMRFRELTDIEKAEVADDPHMQELERRRRYVMGQDQH
jgi:ribosomal protein S27AE